MEKNYKFSKFNTYAENDSGELLIYNSIEELNSMCKIRSEEAFLYKEAIAQDNVNLLPENQIGLLMKSSMVVDSSEDELRKLEYYRIRVVTQVQQKNVLGITILPTGKCNFRCEYCYESFHDGKMQQYVQDAIINFIRRKIIYHSGVSISWFGGEPLLVLDIINYISRKVIAICDSLHRTYFASITTNGYLLTADVMKDLIKDRIFLYQITLDGTSEIHDKYRHLANGAPTFKRIESNLLAIKKMFKTGSIRIILRCNFTRESFNYIDKFTEWFKTNFGDDKRFLIFVRTVGLYGDGGDNLSSVMMNDGGVGKICDSIFESERNNNDCGNCRMSNVSYLSLGACVCYAGMDNSYVFDPVGKVRKCTVALSQDYNIVGEIVNGEVIINAKAMAKWVVPRPMHKECFDCSFAGACMDNVCHTNKAQGIENKWPNCPHEKSAVKSLLLLYDKFEQIKYIDEI